MSDVNNHLTKYKNAIYECNLMFNPTQILDFDSVMDYLNNYP